MGGHFLVTGGAGFIGSHVTEAFLRRGDRVVVLDNFDDYYDPAQKRMNLAVARSNANCTILEGDVRRERDVQAAFSLGTYTAVVHLAARAGVRSSLLQPLLYNEVNVGGTLQLLEATKRLPSTHFVFGSSSSVYGATCPVPFTEDCAADRPSSPYAASKRSAEIMSYAYSHLYGIPVTCLRFFTVYGARQRPEMAIHRFARLISERRPVDILGDGSSRRDYTFVDDIVAGVLGAVDSPTGYRTYNLGTGATTGLLDLVQMLGQRLDREPLLNFLSDQPGDVRVTCANTSRAQRDLGYSPHTSIEDGLTEFVTWYQGVRST